MTDLIAITQALADPRCQEFIETLANIIVADAERQARLHLLLRESDDTISSETESQPAEEEAA